MIEKHGLPLGQPVFSIAVKSAPIGRLWRPFQGRSHFAFVGENDGADDIGDQGGAPGEAAHAPDHTDDGGVDVDLLGHAGAHAAQHFLFPVFIDPLFHKKPPFFSEYLLSV